MKTDKNEQSLKDVLISYDESSPARFHMPGHKGFSDDPVLKKVFPYDVTEISATDDLYRSSGAIKHLEQRFAEFYSAKASFLLVNGSTAGNIAMLLSLGCGKSILLGRDCHCSALSGIALAGHEVFSVFPEIQSGIITPQTVEKAFANAEKPFDAVFLTSPNYYGKVIDVERIAEIVHSHGALLFIDAAHGAHFPFSRFLPANPSCADAWVVSCHKTLGAFTQTAILNLGKSNPIKPERMLSMLAMVQTSSPSFVFMRSLENVLDSPWDWDAHCKRIFALRKKLSGINGLKIEGNPDEIFFPSGTRKTFDITRLVLSFSGISGFALNDYLEQKGIYAEMCDAESIVLITSPADIDEWYKRLFNALSEFSDRFIKKDVSARCAETAQSPSETAKCETDADIFRIADLIYQHKQARSIREAMLGDSYSIDFDSAEGKICAQAVGIYPPGTALLFPGEKIEKTGIDILNKYRRFGAKLFGLENDKIRVLVNDESDDGEIK